jgi:hypothetical protein
VFEGTPLFLGARVDQINRQMKVACHDSVRGSGFQPQGLGIRGPERHYSCVAERPARSYGLDTFLKDRKTYAVQLSVCCADKACP